MRLNRFLASLLALMMVFSLLPAFGLTAGAEEEGQITLVDTENEGQIAPAAAAVPAEEADESPSLWVCGVEVTEVNASDVLGDGRVSYDAATNTLTFSGNPTKTGSHNGAVIDAQTPDVLTINSSKTLYLGSSDEDYGVYAENGLVVNIDGTLGIDVFSNWDGVGIFSANGPVTINGSFSCEGGIGGIQCTGGTVKVTKDFYYLSPGDSGYGIKQSGEGGVDIGGSFSLSSATLGISSTGPVHVAGTVSMKGGGGLRGIVTTSGGVVCDSSVEISGNPASGGIDAGESEEGIYIGGNVDISTGNSPKTPVLNAAGGPITVKGNLSIPAGCGQQCVYANGNITVTGNATIKNGYPYNSSSPDKGMAMMSKEGSIHVTGNCTCSSSGTSVYAANDILIEGTANFRFGRSKIFDYGVMAETGTVSVVGKLEVYGTAEYMVFGGQGIALGGDAIIGEKATGTLGPTFYSGKYGLYSPNGAITHAAGAWDILVTEDGEALHGAQGINIGGGSGVVYPRNGLVTALSGYSTVTEEDGATVATHVIIDDKPAVILTFDAGENTTLAYDTVALPYGSNYTTPPWPSREGDWVYLGWYLNPGEGTNAGIGDKLTSSVIFTEDTTIYFHWRLPGDVDGNGKVELADVILLARYVKANGEGIAIVKNSGDIDGNKAVELADVILLARYVKAGCTGYEIH